MDVSTVTATTTAATQRSSSQSPATLSYNNFLKLLLEQMKNQDPTDPMKSTDYMAQLATFSQVEQSMIGNSKLDSLLTSSALSQVDSVIGRTVTSSDGSISGQVKSVRITNEGALAQLSNGQELLLGAGVVVS